MSKIKKNFLIAILVAFQSHIKSDLVNEKILKINKLDNAVSCFIYEPYLGIVNNIEDLEIKSEKFEITDDEILILNGDVELDFPDGLLNSQKVRVDKDRGYVDFKRQGQIFFKDYFFKAEEGTFSRDDGYINLKNGEAFLNSRNLIISFEELNGDLDDKINLSNVQMTSCLDSTNGWAINADKVSLDESTKRGIARNVRIKILDKSLIKLPVLPFATSNENMSGFLEPTLSYSSDGLDFVIPYYKTISKRSDITIAARNISERGSGIETNYRNLHGKKNNLRNIDLIYFNSDKEHKKMYPSQSDARWAFSVKDSYLDKKTLWIDIDWSKASDDLVLRDISGEITSIGSQREQNLRQNISINGIYKNVEFKISYNGFQSLNPILTNGYKTLPSINIRYFKSLKGFSIEENLNLSVFKADDVHGFYGYQNKSNQFPFFIDPVEGSRVFSDFKIYKSFNLNTLNIYSGLGLKSINYNLDNSQQSQSVNIPNFIVDINTLFFKKNKMDIHLLKPRLTIGYVGYKNQDSNPIFDTNKISMMNQLFNINRFSGMDRIGDQKFYTLNLEYKKRMMHMDKISLSVSKKFYLEDRKVFLDSMHMSNDPMSQMNMAMMNMSSQMNGMMDMSQMDGMMKMPMDEGPIMIMGKWMPSMKTMIMSYTSYIEESNKIPMGGITINHKFRSGSMGYAKRYTRMSGDFGVTLDYSELFADIKIKNKVSLIAKIKYDDETSKKIESVFGIGYENCCIALRLTTSDKNLSKYLDNFESTSYDFLNEAWNNVIEIENKSRVNFQFEFKGLNSTFEKAGKALNNSILKY